MDLRDIGRRPGERRNGLCGNSYCCLLQSDGFSKWRKATNPDCYGPKATLERLKPCSCVVLSTSLNVCRNVGIYLTWTLKEELPLLRDKSARLEDFSGDKSIQIVVRTRRKL